jgi:tetratricopeptide (TPR) repeat protein
LGDDQKALHLFQKAVLLDPLSPKTHYHLGLQFEKLQEYKQAEQCYQESITIDGNNLTAKKSFQRLLTKMGKTQEAQTEYLDYINTRSNKTLRTR